MTLLDSINLRNSAAHSLRTGKAVDARDEDRVCREHTCRTRLSRYNPAPSCSVHEGWADPARPRRSPSESDA